MTIRSLVGTIVAVAGLAFGLGATASGQTIEVFKSATCGCCSGWIAHIEQNGFSAKAQNLAAGQLARVKADAGLSPDLQSCHTAKIGGYVIEGHVPAEDIRRLLAEKPDVIGLTVPGMPLGSPGMEAGNEKEPFEVLLVRRDGKTEVFSRH
ncbi:MAG TPA: DUF411 domain-containing protein [Hyphomicrobiaceae bacterium]|jgi:hypothetical protein